MSKIVTKMRPSIKIIIVGDAYVGKSSLMTRYISNEFTGGIEPTIGVEHRTKHIIIEDTDLNLNIWDTTGQEKFRAVTKLFFKAAHGCIIVFDVTRRQTLENVSMWLSEVQQKACDYTISILVGNKCDIKEREVTADEATKFAKKQQLQYFQTSSLTGENVNTIFDRLVKKIWEVKSTELKKVKQVQDKKMVDLNDFKDSKRRCCN